MREKREGEGEVMSENVQCYEKVKQDEARGRLGWGCGWVGGRKQHVWSRKALKISRSMSNLLIFFASQVITSESGICKLK